MAITDSKYKRIVVKVGTSTITHDGGKANLRRLESLCRVISDLENAAMKLSRKLRSIALA